MTPAYPETRFARQGTATPHCSDIEKRCSDRSRSQLALRQHDRIPTHLSAVLYAGRSFRPTVIRDISQHGARLDGAIGIFPGDVVEITLIAGYSKPAIVRWWLNGSCGVSFDVPLDTHDPFLKSIIRAARKNDCTVECK
jgi:hypothetical protein